MNKIEKLHEKFDNFFGYELTKAIIETDKTSTHKYAEYILVMSKNFINKDNDSLSISNNYMLFLTNTLKFEELLPHIEVKDIYNKIYRNPKVLDSTIKNAQYKIENSIIEKTKNREDIFVIYENDNFILLEPLTKQTAIFYGMNTQWCTAYTKATKDYYHDYKGKLLYLINKNKNINEPFKKIGITGRLNIDPYMSCYDQKDKVVLLFSLAYNGWEYDDLIIIEKQCEKYFTRNTWYKKFKPKSFYYKRKKYLKKLMLPIT